MVHAQCIATQYKKIDDNTIQALYCTGDVYLSYAHGCTVQHWDTIQGMWHSAAPYFTALHCTVLHCIPLNFTMITLKPTFPARASAALPPVNSDKCRSA